MKKLLIFILLFFAGITQAQYSSNFWAYKSPNRIGLTSMVGDTVYVSTFTSDMINTHDIYRQGVALVPGTVNGNYWSLNVADIYRLSKVGIGTTSPGYTLDVNGDIRVNQFIRTPASTGLLIAPSGGQTALYDGSTVEYLDIYNGGTKAVEISSSGNSYLNGGNVGIGTTSPSVALDVNGSIRAMGYNQAAIGAGPILDYLSGTARLFAYDYGSAVFKPISIQNGAIYVEGVNQGNVGIGLTTGIDSNLTVNNGGWFKRGLRTSARLLVGDLVGVYSYINPGDALWTVSSDSSKKDNIKDAIVNLSNFDKVIPKTFTFKKEYFLEQFDEKSVPDSVDKQIKVPIALRVLVKDMNGKEVLSDSLQTIKISNKAKKDSIRTAFIANNLADASQKSKIVHTGFIAQEFNSNMFGSNSTEIDYNKIIAVMWMKIRELEARIAVLEAK